MFFHVDMDAFYAAIEQLDDPSLRGRPVLVGGRGNRGVVAACSYEARRYGVHSAMPMGQALQRCPDATVVPVRMDRYREVSRSIHAQFSAYSPAVYAISIDEAFLDMTGTERILGKPVSVAQTLKRDIREISKLTISVGIGSSRFIAKLASKVDKPDGLYHVRPGEEADFVARLELKDLWGLGKSTLRRLQGLGIDSIRALREQRIEVLRGHFGSSGGEFLYQICRGEDPGVGERRGDRHSISAEQTFQHDEHAPERLRREILSMAEEVIQRTIQENWRGRTVHVKFRFPSFETHTASRTLATPPRGTRELAEIAERLLETRRGGRALRLLGVGISGDPRGDSLSEPRQGDLFEQSRGESSLDPVVAALRKKYGPQSIRRAYNLSSDDT